MRAAGAEWQAISDVLGYGSKSNAHRAVSAALAAAPNEAVEELRRLELLKLDALSAPAWAILDAPHPLVSAGRVMAWDGEPLRDPQPVLAAVDRLLRISERRCRLLGLDSPIRVDGGVLSIAEIDRQLAVLDAELTARDDLAEDD